jgi:cell shape-determining protein MreD
VDVSRGTCVHPTAEAGAVDILRSTVRTPARRPPDARQVGRGTQITYTTLLLAFLTGIVHAALAPLIVIGDAHPNFVLVAVVLVAARRGFGPSVAWAVVAGLTANLLTPELLGSVPLQMLLVAAGVSGGQRLFARLWWAYPAVAAILGSFLVDAVGLGLMFITDTSVAGPMPVGRIVAAGLLNGALVAILIVPAHAWDTRMGERPAW